MDSCINNSFVTVKMAINQSRTFAIVNVKKSFSLQLAENISSQPFKIGVLFKYRVESKTSN